MTATPTRTAPNGSPPWLRRLYLPAYSIQEAAKYSKTNARVVSSWHYAGGTLGPALPGRERKRPLSYLQLIEVAFVATFRSLGVSLQRIRKAREYAAQTLAAEFPFAEYRWQTEGSHVLLDLSEIEKDTEIGRLIVADVGGQIAWQRLVGERFAQFDYEHGLALVWYVAGRDAPVKIDPRIAFGAPTVHGIPTWAIKGRWLAGEPATDIQKDFGLDAESVRHALAFEGISMEMAA